MLWFIHNRVVQNWSQIDGAVVGPGPFVIESPFKHLSKFASFSRRLFFFGASLVFGFIFVDVMSDPKDLHRMSLWTYIHTAFSAWHFV